METQERLRQAIDEERQRLRGRVPADREGALLALLRLLDWLPGSPEDEPVFDLITGHRLANLGGNRALQLALEAGEHAGDADGDDLEGWAAGFLRDCDRLADIELVLGHVETGFMRLADDAGGGFDAWIATKRAPTGWRERADIDWWAGQLARRYAPALRALIDERGDSPDGSFSQRLAERHVAMIAYQIGYPPEAVIGGCSVQTYLDLLRWLIALALQKRDQGSGTAPHSGKTLVSGASAALKTDATVIEQAIAAFTLDFENAAYHAATPGVAAAPVVRIDADRLVLSLHGLTAESLLFLTRELRRRDAQDYHNTAHLRENVFRQDLYALFPDRRFVTSPVRLVLRREDRNARTDVDAVIFDRKTGTLGLFELKSQDPFARSTAELTRQRDTVLYANRQLSGVLDWVKRHGANELLDRIDHRTAKMTRAQKVYPFVLGRYLAHFSDGAAPDPRAAWGTWPQVLRLLDAQPAAESNPIASLFNRLTKDEPVVSVPDGAEAREIAVGEVRVTVYPSYGAVGAGANDRAAPDARG